MSKPSTWDWSEDGKAYREMIRKQKQEQRDRRVPKFDELRAKGFQVRELTPYQFRVNERLDIYPTWAKWHDIHHNERGTFTGMELVQFVQEFFGDDKD